MPTPTATVIQQLELRGTVEPGGYFNQTSRLEQSTVAAQQVDEGYCNGVCIDWIRRVVLGGGIVMNNPTNLNSQVWRQATTQIRIKSKTTQRSAIIGVRNDLVLVSNQQLNQDPKTISALLAGRVRQYINFNLRPDGRYPAESVRQWLTLLAEMRDEADHTLQVGWTAFAHNLDTYHRQQRAQAGKDNSSRPFSEIKILSSTDRRTYVGGIEGAMNELLQLDEFTPGTALLLGFGIDLANHTKSGHAVAVYRPDVMAYLLFDPNYGVFRCPTIGRVLGALCYLFDEDDRGAQEGTEPIYGEDGDTVTGGVSHIVFGRG